MDERFDPNWLEAHRVRLERSVARAEIVGIGHVMTEIERLVGRLRDSAAAAALRARAPRGLLFWGPPGVGKTYVVRYLAGAIGDVSMYELSADELSPAAGGALDGEALRAAVAGAGLRRGPNRARAEGDPAGPERAEAAR